MKKMALCALLVLSLGAPANIALAEPAKEIVVSAAASLKNAFAEIGKLYEAGNKDVKVSFNFGASGDLMTQIKGGAPVDVFASAALKDMDALEKDGLILKDTRRNFSGNTVALIVPRKSKISVRSFEDLKKPEIKKIAVGNPKTVPAGRYTEEVFRYYAISGMIREKLVFSENVRQVLEYVARGEVDAGVVYGSDAVADQEEVIVTVIAPEVSHQAVVYPIAAVTGTKNEKAAKAFISVVLSDDGKKILGKYGFKPLQ